MKLVKTVLLFEKGAMNASTKEWKDIYKVCKAGVAKCENPPGSGSFSIRMKRHKRDSTGKETKQWERNGVSPLKDQFFAHLSGLGWKLEEPVALEEYFSSMASQRDLNSILKVYPSMAPFVDKPSSKPGEFDAYVKTATGARVVIEWETGNVSSSHRSLNKMCLCMIAGLIDFGVLVIPDRALYRALTDRIGNFEELAPYLVFWNKVSEVIECGMLAIVVVSYDHLIDKDNESFPYLKSEPQGRSAEGAAKIK